MPHEAEIRVESAPGRGATFDAYFPALEHISPDASGPDEWRALTGSETILIAEDQVAVRLLIRETLERYGYRIIDATDGRDALEVAERPENRHIDLLITDVVMPRMNGLDLARELIARRPALKAIMISGYSDDPTIPENAQSLGISFLGKPFRPDSLLSLVRRVLDGEVQAENVLEERVYANSR